MQHRRVDGGRPAGQFAVGLSNHTDFLRAHREGRLDVRARPVHQGRTGQLWHCDITREDGKLVAQGRVRLQNVPLPELHLSAAGRVVWADATARGG